MKSDKLPSVNEVHIRFAWLDLEDHEQVGLERRLASAEIARAERLKVELARDRFVAGRLFLRKTLASYLGIDPEELVLGEGEWGKPYIAQGKGSELLSFNLSHAAGLAVLAVSRNREVGIDLEKTAEDLPYQNIARMFFSPLEKEDLFSLPQQEQLAAFYRCWSRKEAYVKGCGRGFSIPTDIFDVSLLPGQTPALIAHRESPGEPERWRLIDIPAPEGFCATLAIEGESPEIRVFQEV
jgi:4'-phosphopantetheinyl transferase